MSTFRLQGHTLPILWEMVLQRSCWLTLLPNVLWKQVWHAEHLEIPHRQNKMSYLNGGILETAQAKECVSTSGSGESTMLIFVVSFSIVTAAQSRSLCLCCKYERLYCCVLAKACCLTESTSFSKRWTWIPGLLFWVHSLLKVAFHKHCIWIYLFL